MPRQPQTPAVQSKPLSCLKQRQAIESRTRVGALSVVVLLFAPHVDCALARWCNNRTGFELGEKLLQLSHVSTRLAFFSVNFLLECQPPNLWLFTRIMSLVSLTDPRSGGAEFVKHPTVVAAWCVDPPPSHDAGSLATGHATGPEIGLDCILERHYDPGAYATAGI